MKQIGMRWIRNKSMEIRNLDGDVISRGMDVKSILKYETSPRVHTLRRKSFKQADLRNLDLEGAKICASSDVKSSRRSDFMGSDFSGAKLKGAQLVGLDLRAVNFTGCDMRGVAIVLCDMRGACLDDVDMSGYTEDKTGHVSWISECVLDRLRASDADFQEAQITAKSAEGAVFRDCNFEDAGFKGVWNDATFYSCNLEDTYPGCHGSGIGAEFGVHLSPDCNTTDMFLEKCYTLPDTLPNDHVELPDEAWDEDGFEIEHEDDLFEEKAKSAAAEARKRIYALAAKMMAQDAVQAEKAKKKRQKARADELRASAIRREKEAQRLRDIVEAARKERARTVAATPKVTALPPLTGEFEFGLVSVKGMIYRKRITFNRPLSTGYATVRDQGFRVSGGRVTGARRVDRRSDRWELTIQSDGSGDMVVLSTDALHGKSGRTLEAQISTTIVRKQ